MTSFYPPTGTRIQGGYHNIIAPKNLIEIEIKNIKDTVFQIIPPTTATWAIITIKGSPLAIKLDGTDPDISTDQIVNETFQLDDSTELTNFRGLATTPNQATSLTIEYYSD